MIIQLSWLTPLRRRPRSRIYTQGKVTLCDIDDTIEGVHARLVIGDPSWGQRVTVLLTRAETAATSAAWLGHDYVTHGSGRR